jgi:hypothetical protein
MGETHEAQQGITLEQAAQILFDDFHSVIEAMKKDPLFVADTEDAVMAGRRDAGVLKIAYDDAERTRTMTFEVMPALRTIAKYAELLQPKQEGDEQ